MRYLLTICLLLLIAWPAFADGCEVLVAAKSQDCAEADSAMCWRKGNPLYARPIGFPWPRGENPDSTSDFVVITVSDKSVDHTNQWLERQRYDGPDSTLTGLRLRRIKWSALPNPVQEQLLETGRYTATWPQIKPFIQNMKTGEMGG